WRLPRSNGPITATRRIWLSEGMDIHTQMSNSKRGTIMESNSGMKTGRSDNRFEQFVGSGDTAANAWSRLQSAIENLGTNVLISDQDLILIYMNKRSEETLRAIEGTIQKELGLTVDELIGGSLDRFHGDRAREIRRTLSNPRNLPVKSDIRLGD